MALSKTDLDRIEDRVKTHVAPLAAGLVEVDRRLTRIEGYQTGINERLDKHEIKLVEQGNTIGFTWKGLSLIGLIILSWQSVRDFLSQVSRHQ